MDTELIKYAVGQGIFCGLFVWLLISTTKRSEQREDKLMGHNEGYQKALADLSAGQQRLTDAVTEMRADIADVKEEIEDLKRA